ncbi:MAG: hypothetical protein R3C68_16665 [Myxococcota bacterium]
MIAIQAPEFASPAVTVGPTNQSKAAPDKRTEGPTMNALDSPRHQLSLDHLSDVGLSDGTIETLNRVDDGDRIAQPDEIARIPQTNRTELAGVRLYMSQTNAIEALEAPFPGGRADAWFKPLAKREEYLRDKDASLYENRQSAYELSIRLCRTRRRATVKSPLRSSRQT